MVIHNITSVVTQFLGVITFYATFDPNFFSSAPAVVVVDAYGVPTASLSLKGAPVVGRAVDGGVTASEGEVLECIPR
jgi:hypothetical protein